MQFDSIDEGMGDKKNTADSLCPVFSQCGTIQPFAPQTPQKQSIKGPTTPLTLGKKANPTTPKTEPRAALPQAAQPPAYDDQDAPSTPKSQCSSVAKVMLTPQQTRFALLQIIPSQDPHNIMINPDIRYILQTIANRDALEEIENVPWDMKDERVTSLIAFDKRVFPYLAPVYRQNLSIVRQFSEIIATPERNDIRHILTVETVIKILMHGISYLSLPADSNMPRLCIVAPAEMCYSQGIRFSGRLDSMAWVTLTFAQNHHNRWTCIHYFFDGINPLYKCYRDDKGQLKKPYFMELFEVSLNIINGRLSFDIDPEAYQVCWALLKHMKAQECIASPAPTLVSAQDFQLSVQAAAWTPKKYFE